MIGKIAKKEITNRFVEAEMLSLFLLIEKLFGACVRLKLGKMKGLFLVFRGDFARPF